MASTLTFDMKDPETKALVDGWADNSDYTVTLTVRTGTGPRRNVATVVGPIEETEAEVEEEVVEEEAEAAPGPAAVSAAMGSAMGG